MCLVFAGKEGNGFAGGKGSHVSWSKPEKEEISSCMMDRRVVGDKHKGEQGIPGRRWNEAGLGWGRGCIV